MLILGHVLGKVTYFMILLSLYINSVRKVLLLFCFTDEETEEA